MWIDWLLYAACGAAGGLSAELLKSGYIELPHRRDRRLYLGSIGGVLFGCVAGLIGDAGPLNAFVWGLGGVGFVAGLAKMIERGDGPGIKREG